MRKKVFFSFRMIFWIIFLCISTIILISENNVLLTKTVNYLNKNYNLDVNYQNVYGGLLSGIKIDGLNYQNDFSGDIVFKLGIPNILKKELNIYNLEIVNFKLLKSKEELEKKYKSNSINTKESNSKVLINKINLKHGKISTDKSFNLNISKDFSISSINIDLENSSFDLNQILDSRIESNQIKIVSNKFFLLSAILYSNKKVNIKNIFEIDTSLINENLKDKSVFIRNKKLLIKNKIEGIGNELKGDILINNLNFNINNINNEINLFTDFSINKESKILKTSSDLKINNTYSKSKHQILLNYSIENKTQIVEDLLFNIKSDITPISRNITRKIQEENESLKELSFNIKPFSLTTSGSLSKINVEGLIDVDINNNLEKFKINLNTKNILNNLKTLNSQNQLIISNEDKKIQSDLNIKLDTNFDNIAESLHYSLNGNLDVKEIESLLIKYKLYSIANINSSIKNNIEIIGDFKELKGKIISLLNNDNEYISINPKLETELYLPFNKKDIKLNSYFTNEQNGIFNGKVSYLNNKFDLNLNINEIKIKKDNIQKYLKTELPLNLKLSFTDNKNLNLIAKNNNSSLTLESNDLENYILNLNVYKELVLNGYKPLKVKLKSDNLFNKNLSIIKNSINADINNIKVYSFNNLENNILESELKTDELLNIKNIYKLNEKNGISKIKINLSLLNETLNKIKEMHIDILEGNVNIDNEYTTKDIHSKINGDLLIKDIMKFKNINSNLNFDFMSKKGNFKEISFLISDLQAHETVNNYINKQYNLTNGLFSLDKINNIYYKFNLNNNFNIKGKYYLIENLFDFNFDIKNEHIIVKDYTDSNFSAKGNFKIKDFINFDLNSDININNTKVLYDLSKLKINTDQDVLVFKTNKELKKYKKELKKENIWIDNFIMKLNVINSNPIIYKNKEINLKSDIKMEVIKEKNKEITLNGNLSNIDGYYNFFNKKFNIIDSKIFFNTSLEPLIDLKLEYKNEDITIFINISGDAHDPIVKLTSDPIMEETDIYSYLLFNKSSSELTELDKTNNSDNYDLSLLLLTNTFTQEVADSLGIDNIKVYMKSDQIGYQVEKEINDKITLIYNQDAEENKIKIEYKFNQNVGLESILSEKNELNLFYKKKYK